MARSVLLLAYAITVLGPLPAHAADACTDAAGKTVLENKWARVLSRSPRKGDVRFIGCVRGGPTRLIAETSDDSDARVIASDFRLAGTWAAWKSEVFGGFGSDAYHDVSIEMCPLRQGCPRGRPPLAVNIEQSEYSVEYSGLEAFVGRGDGATAWMLRHSNGYVEVDAVLAGSDDATPVGFGREIDVSSLELTNDAVAWRQDGVGRVIKPQPSSTPAPTRNATGPQRLDARFGTCGLARYPSRLELQGPPQLERSLAGGVTSAGAFNGVFVSRFTPAGALDPTFGSNGVGSALDDKERNWISDLVVEPDGRPVLAGARDAFRSAFVARFDADSVLDRSFGTGGFVRDPFVASAAEIRDLAPDPSGGILVAGSRSGTPVLARLRGDGSLDPSFGGSGGLVDLGGGHGAVAGVASRDDGEIAATVLDDSSATGAVLVRLAPDGRIETMSAFSLPGKVQSATLIPLPDGGTTIGGTLLNMTGEAGYLVELDAAGNQRADFGTEGGRLLPGSPLFAVQRTRDGHLLVATDIGRTPGGVGRGSGALLEFRPDGGLESRFGFGGVLAFRNLHMSDIALADDGTLIAAGGPGYVWPTLARIAIDAPATDIARSQRGVCAPQPTKATIARLRRTGSMTVRMTVMKPGRTTLTGQLRVGARQVSAGRTVLAGNRLGTKLLRLRLTAAARRLLARAKKAAIVLTSRAPGGHAAKTQIVMR